VAINKNKINDNALKFLQKGQIRKAIKEYEKILAEDPSDVRTLLKKGDLLTRLGDKAEAIDTYQKVAAIYSKQGFHLKAVAVYKQILKTEPNLVDVHLKLAEEYQNLGITGDAMNHLQVVAQYYEQNNQSQQLAEILKRIVDLDPSNLPSRIKLAELYSREGMIPQAVEQFSRAAEELKAANRIEDYIKVAERLIFHDSTNTSLIKELANIYLQQGDIKRALGKLQVCFRADPQDLEVLGMLAQAFQGLGQVSKTISVYKEIAKIYQEQGSLVDARKMYQRILELAPDDAEARAALGSIKQEDSQPNELDEELPILQDEGEVLTHPASSASSAFMDAATELGSLQSQPNELDLDAQPEEELLTEDSSAEVMIVESEESAPEQEEAPATTITEPADRETINRLLTETDVCVKYGLHNKAYEHLKKIFDLDPNNIAAHQRLKDIYFKAGQIDHAVQELFTLSYLCQRAGDKQKAVDYLLEVLSHKPDHPDAINGLRELGVEPPAAVEEEFESIDIGSQSSSSSEIIEISDEHDKIQEQDESTRLANNKEIQKILKEVSPEPAENELDFPDSEQTIDVASIPTGELDLNTAPPVIEVEEGEPEVIEEISDKNPEEEASISEPELIPFDGGEEFEQFPQENEDQQEHTARVGVTEAGPVLEISQSMTVDYVDGLKEKERQDLLKAAVAVEGQPAREKQQQEEQVSEEAEEGEEAGEGEEGPDLDELLESIDFLIQQKLFEYAKAELEQLESDYPGNPEVLARKETIEAGLRQARQPAVKPPKVSPEKKPTVPAVPSLQPAQKKPTVPVVTTPVDAKPAASPSLPPKPAVGPPPATATAAQPRPAADNKIDLSSAIADEVGEGFGSEFEEDFQYSIEDVFSEFKKGVAKVVDKTDSATHYDLGIAYKEMGLLEDAIGEFQLAAQDEKKYASAMTMIGLCYREMGQYSEAINRLKDALHGNAITDVEATGIYYELGQTYELIKEASEANYYYQKVYKRDQNFRDIATKVKATEDNKEGGDKKTVGPKSNISYM